MKRIYILFVLVFTCMGVFSQANYDAFVEHGYIRKMILSLKLNCKKVW